MGKTINRQTLPVKRNDPRPPSDTEIKHYLYSWVSRKTMPSGRAFVRVRRELSRLRNELIARYGGDRAHPEAITLIDSVVEALGVQKLMGLYIRKAGIIRRDSLKHGNLELHSALAKNWISYANVVRQNIMALQSLKVDAEPEITLAEILAEHDEEKAQADEIEDGLGVADNSCVNASNSGDRGKVR